MINEEREVTPVGTCTNVLGKLTTFFLAMVNIFYPSLKDSLKLKTKNILVVINKLINTSLVILNLYFKTYLDTVVLRYFFFKTHSYAIA